MRASARADAGPRPGGPMRNDSTSPAQGAGATVEPRAPADERRTAAWVGKCLRIEGKIVSSEDLTIDGEVDGTIEVGNKSLVIGSGATVRADLNAHSITISGAVTGNVKAADRVSLRATGSVEGDIVTPR